MKVTRLELDGVLLIEYPANKDNRALFHQTYCKADMQESGIHHEFVEEISYHPMKKGTLYGIHFQNRPKAQTKLIYCVKGRILDFVVDLRRQSGTYKRWLSVELSADNRQQMLIPAGFGHTALTLEDDTSIIMRIDSRFDPKLSRAISYKDPDLGLPISVAHPILSPQDRDAPLLKDSDCNV